MSDDDLELGKAIEEYSFDEMPQRTHLLDRLFGKKKKEYENWQEAEWDRFRAEAGDIYYEGDFPLVPVFKWYLSRAKLFEGKDRTLVAARAAYKKGIESIELMAEETKLRYRQDNPHLVFLENLKPEEAEEAALRFLEVHMKCDLLVRKAQDEAKVATLKVFRDFGGESLDEDQIGRTSALRYLYKAFGKPNRMLLDAVRKDKERWPEDIENIISPYLFVFEDIVMLDDRAMQRVLREVDTNQLAKALKGVESMVQDKVFRNMSKRAAALLKEDMDYMGPVRKKDVEKVNDEIIEVIFRLEEQGDIVIPFEEGDVLI